MSPTPSSDSGGLSREDVALVRISAALASGDAELLDAALGDAVPVLPARAVEEALLQSYLFLGYPAALNALARWRRVAGTAPAGRDESGPGEWPARGVETCRVVYAGQYESLRENIRALHPEMEEWMVTEGYGKVLGRPGLSLRRRELCIVSILAVCHAPRQLYSHLRGALHAGATPEAVEAALEVALEEASRARTVDLRERNRVARDTWARLRRRRPDPESPSSS